MAAELRPGRWGRSHFVGASFFVVLLFSCFAYYLAFAAEFRYYDDDSGLFQLALNAHDHLVYLENISRLRDGEFAYYELRNDVGIAAMYSVLAAIAPFLVDESFSLIALSFNLLTLCLCYALYSAICDRLQLGIAGKVSFVANLSLIYFAQLINKDMLTVLVFLLAAWSGLKGRVLWLLALLPLMAIIRQQLALFTLIYVLLMVVRRPIRWMVFLYILTAFVAGLLSVFASLFGAESLEDGFTAYLVEFNRQYYVGYIIFNPLRALQYVVDAYLSFSFWTETGGIDTAKLLRLPQLVLLTCLVAPLSKLVTRFASALQQPSCKPLVVVVVSYMLVWLMNPTVNARYVMLITPILVLFALHVRRHKLLASR